MGTYHYVDIDYQRSALGVRFEPKDMRIADALRQRIPQEERMYIWGKRKWIVEPRWAATVLKIIEEFCPNTPIYIEEKNKDLILSLLFGRRGEGTMIYQTQMQDPAHGFGPTISDLRREYVK